VNGRAVRGGSAGSRRRGENTKAETVEGGEGEEKRRSIILDLSKTDNKTFTPNKVMKSFQRRLRKTFHVKINKDDLVDTGAGLSVKDTSCVIMVIPTAPLEEADIKALKEYVSDGGSLFIMAQEGGESRPNENISELTTDFGIGINNDSVTRAAYKKDFYRPKEVFIGGASLIPEIDNYSGKKTSAASDLDFQEEEYEGSVGGGLDIVYPYGCTLNIQKPAIPIISSGKMSFPANRCLVGVAKLNKGTIMVMGSAKPFYDEYISKADNTALLDGIMNMLTIPEAKIGNVENDRPEFKEAVQVPDMEALAERLRLSPPLTLPLSPPVNTLSTKSTPSMPPMSASPSRSRSPPRLSPTQTAANSPEPPALSLSIPLARSSNVSENPYAYAYPEGEGKEPEKPVFATAAQITPDVTKGDGGRGGSVTESDRAARNDSSCLEEPEDLPTDLSKLFDFKLFNYNTDMVPETVKLYKRLNVNHESLSLIPPQFEVPLPPLQPAVFLPCMRDLPPPALDLFDLDQHFCDERVQLAQLTNKCQNKDLDYYVINAGQILNVNTKIKPQGELTAKEVLHFIFQQLVNYKKLDSKPLEGQSPHPPASPGNV